MFPKYTIRRLHGRVSQICSVGNNCYLCARITSGQGENPDRRLESASRKAGAVGTTAPTVFQVINLVSLDGRRTKRSIEGRCALNCMP